MIGDKLDGKAESQTPGLISKKPQNTNSKEDASMHIAALFTMAKVWK